MAEVVRASHAVTGESANRRALKLALVKLTEGQYQIPTNIVTLHATVPSKRESIFVHCMF